MLLLLVIKSQTSHCCETINAFDILQGNGFSKNTQTANKQRKMFHFKKIRGKSQETKCINILQKCVTLIPDSTFKSWKIKSLNRASKLMHRAQVDTKIYIKKTLLQDDTKTVPILKPPFWLSTQRMLVSCWSFILSASPGTYMKMHAQAFDTLPLHC